MISKDSDPNKGQGIQQSRMLKALNDFQLGLFWVPALSHDTGEEVKLSPTMNYVVATKQVGILSTDRRESDT